MISGKAATPAAAANADVRFHSKTPISDLDCSAFVSGNLGPQLSPFFVYKEQRAPLRSHKVVAIVQDSGEQGVHLALQNKQDGGEPFGVQVDTQMSMLNIRQTRHIQIGVNTKYDRRNDSVRHLNN